VFGGHLQFDMGCAVIAAVVVVAALFGLLALAPYVIAGRRDKACWWRDE
jgi:hypothetical protein